MLKLGYILDPAGYKFTFSQGAKLAFGGVFPGVIDFLPPDTCLFCWALVQLFLASGLS
jgi:hypothetical protein